MADFLDADLIIAAHFEAIIERLATGLSPKQLSKNDRIIYYVVSTRCEIDQTGYKSVFDQLLDESEVLFLIESLQSLDEPELARCFEDAHLILQSTGFFIHPPRCFEESSLILDEKLKDIQKRVTQKDALWSMDTKLAELVRLGFDSR